MINPIQTSFVIGGVVGGQEYHYRLVASNTFGVVMGTDRSFLQPGFIQTVISGLPGVEQSSWACRFHWAAASTSSRTALLPTIRSASTCCDSNDDGARNCTKIGPATLQYQFTDPDATKQPARFCRLVWP